MRPLPGKLAILLPGFLMVSLVCTLNAYAEPASPEAIASLHKVLEGKHVSGQTRRGGDLTWTNDPSGKMAMTASSPPGDKNWSSRFDGEWTVDDAGQYCVQAHAPLQRGGDWQFCATIETAADGSMSFNGAGGRRFLVR